MLRRSVYAIALCSLVAVDGAAAQLGYFGQNKVHYRDFDWQILRGEHVDLYFYPEERELASLALTYAEESFAILARSFGHTPQRRIPLIVYALHADFEQTNILPFIPPEGILGVTEFLKQRLAIPFNGNYSEFRHTVRHEMVHAFQLSAISDVRARFGRWRLPDLPLWWTEGLAEWWSGGEDALDETVLRDLTVSGRMPRLRQLALVYNALVYPIGGAIHRWLAHEYGGWRVQVLYRDLWKYQTFDEALAAVYGTPMEELEDAVEYQFRRRYYPQVSDRTPLNVAATLLSQAGIKPVAYRLPDDSVTRFLYLSPRTGYMNIYSGWADVPERDRIEVKGERTEQFESFHSSASRLDVREGVAVFSSRYLERDALFFWDLRSRTVVGRYQFPELSSMLSPAWAPDGRSVVFSGLTQSGYSDLYRLWLEDERLERLTADRHQDLDPSFSPDGASLVFASDRTIFGPEGALNLYLLDLGTRAVRALTHGPWRDVSPRWAANGLIYFTSDRLGVSDVYSVDRNGSGVRETNTLTGVFDPQWMADERALLFSGFHDLTFSVFRLSMDGQPDGGERIALPDQVDTARWAWPELVESEYARASSSPYRPGLGLDFVLGDALIAPGIGSAQGFVFQLSDMLSDHLLYLAGSSFQAQGWGSLFDNINATAFYLNRASRLNWGVGAFRLRGYFYTGDFSTVYEETSFGAFADLRWPLSRFRRIDAQVRIERSDRFDVSGVFEGDPRRVGWLVSNYASYVHDNTLWLATGPIDGSRTNVTVGVTNDLTNGRFDSWTALLDHRQYMRFGLYSAWAMRLTGYHAGGARPRRVGIGGTWGLRGYPRIGNVGGTSAFLISNEIRFPLTHYVSLGFPFGELRFPGVQGALFVDVGGAWVPNAVGRSILGSGGFGLRLPLGYLLTLRLDMGWRFAFGDVYGYSIPPLSEGRWFTDFFFGFNY